MPRNRGVTAIGGVAAVLLVIAAAVILFRPTSAQTFRGSPRMATNEFPNVPLVTHEGKPVKFYDDLIKDKKVVINFIYTDCPDACPLDTAKLVRVQNQLGPLVGRDIFMYSITLDPEHDTPAVLKEYAESYGVEPGWLFLTGERTFIDLVRFKFGERRDKQQHSNTLSIGNGATGQWMTLSMDNDVARLVMEVGKTLDPDWYAGGSTPSFADAPRLRAPEPGETLFMNKCANCHTLGSGGGLGPDLLGVTARRDPAWLARFIAGPDQMRANKDPDALELRSKYPDVLMPNLALTRTQLADLIGFLEARGAP